MQVVLLANDRQKADMLSAGTAEGLGCDWVLMSDELLNYPDADAYFDLLFEPTEERLSLLKQLSQKPVFINYVEGTLRGLPGNMIRINGWNSFLSRPLMEAAANETISEEAEKVISAFNRKVEWTADIPGFITARVLSMIINEAYFALSENVSSKEETDTAMKLGTNYPMGPFQWADNIGLKNIYVLLTELSKTQERYLPCPLLEKEVLQ